MKKYLLSISLLGTGIFYGQSSLMPEPTTGSIKSYVNAAISPATGIPSIGFPVYQLETGNKDFPLSLGLSYHVYNAKPNIPAGEVGLGWSLSSSGVISRQVEGAIDEFRNWTDITEQEADTFYYSIPGHSGKFKIYKSPDANVLMVNNLTGEKIKIDYVRDTSGTKLIINSFKITDDKGFEFHFQDSNLALAKNVSVSTNYKTTFVLNKVVDPAGVEVINYTYDKNIKYQGASTIIQRQVYKLNTASTSKGKIRFEYDFNASIDNAQYSHSDPYSVKSISLLNNAGALLSKYQLVYSDLSVPSEIIDENGNPSEMMANKRILTKIQKLNKNLVTYEETQYEYAPNGFGTPNAPFPDNRPHGNYLCPADTPYVSPATYTIGLLKKITFPTKGYVIYDFEANETYVDRSAADYTAPGTTLSNPLYQYYAKKDIPYDTNTTRNYQFQVTGNSGVQYPVYIAWEMGEDYMETDIRGNWIYLEYVIKNSANVIVNKVTSACSSPGLYKLTPGTYTISITKGGGNGFYRIYNITGVPGPYKNSTPNKIGARVRMIRSYDTDGSLVKTKTFDYSLFSNSLSPSGNYFLNYGSCTGSEYEKTFLYKNVKETEVSGTENNGYTKYYFKTPADYATSGSLNQPYYNITSEGLLEKKEIYNKQNQLAESTTYDYTLQEIAGATQTQSCSINSKPSWIQKIKETGIAYLGQAAYQTVKETTFNPSNFQESLSKTTAQDGSVNEVTTRYASDLGNSRFINKNMISVPLEVETKTDGTILSKVTTQYADNTHFYPTSVVVTDLNQTPETQMTFDIYDNKGNLVQVTDKSGNPVTTIWGYYQTLPIAQIVGVKYNDIASLSVVTAAINASNADANDPTKEGALLTALQNLRLSTQLRAFPVTTYTYDPLIGVTNSVSANGIRQVNEYDASGRLLRVKNSDGQVIKENQYNYKQ